MNSEVQIIISFLFKRSGKNKLKESEIYLSLSLELGWFSARESREFVTYALQHQDTIEAMRERRKQKEHYKKLKKLVPIPIIVGILAALIMYNLYGGDEVFKAFLSWVIGLTLIVTIITYLPKNLEK